EQTLGCVLKVHEDQRALEAHPEALDPILNTAPGQLAPGGHSLETDFGLGTVDRRECFPFPRSPPTPRPSPIVCVARTAFASVHASSQMPLARSPSCHSPTFGWSATPCGRFSATRMPTRSRLTMRSIASSIGGRSTAKFFGSRIANEFIRRAAPRAMAL